METVIYVVGLYIGVTTRIRFSNKHHPLAKIWCAMSKSFCSRLVRLFEQLPALGYPVFITVAGSKRLPCNDTNSVSGFST